MFQSESREQAEEDGVRLSIAGRSEPQYRAILAEYEACGAAISRAGMAHEKAAVLRYAARIIGRSGVEASLKKEGASVPKIVYGAAVRAWICETGEIRAWLRGDPEARDRVVVTLLDRARPRLLAQATGTNLYPRREEFLQEVALATGARATRFASPRDVDIYDPLSWVIGTGKHEAANTLRAAGQVLVEDTDIEGTQADQADDLEGYAEEAGETAGTVEPVASSGAEEGEPAVRPSHPAEWHSDEDPVLDRETVEWAIATIEAWQRHRNGPAANRLVEVMRTLLTPKDVECLATCLRFSGLSGWTLAQAARDRGKREVTLRSEVCRLRKKFREAGVDAGFLDRLMRPDQSGDKPGVAAGDEQKDPAREDDGLARPRRSRPKGRRKGPTDGPDKRS